MEKKEISEEKSIIHSGSIQLLVPFRLCEQNEVTRLVQVLQESVLVVSEINSLNKTVDIKKEFLEERIQATKSISDFITLSLNFSDNDPESGESFADFIMSGDGELLIEDGFTNEIIRIKINNINEIIENNIRELEIVDVLSVNIQEYLFAIIGEKNTNEGFSDADFLARTDMILQPIIAYDGTRQIDIDTMLSVFSNGMAILRLEHSICDIFVQEMSADMGVSYFNKYTLPICICDNNASFGYRTLDVDSNVINLYHEILKTISRFDPKSDLQTVRTSSTI